MQEKQINWRYVMVGAALLAALPTALVRCAPAQTENAATKTTRTFTNPVLDADRPDPDILFDKGTFYMLHTMNGPPAWPLHRSTDMIHWTFVKHLLEPANTPAWIKNSLWAPEVHRVGAKYVMTFTARSTKTDRLCIGLAVSDAIDGPYKVQDAPILSDNVHLLDSHIFQDGDNRKYLLWKRDGETTGGRFGSIRMRELTADALAFRPGSNAHILLDSDDTGQPWERDLVEAPWMLKRDGWYYLVYSGGFIGPDLSYRVGVARSRSLDESFVRYNKNPILGNNEVWGGPGHGAFAQDSNGDYWHLYHARHADLPNDPWANPPGKGRVQLLDKLLFVDGWPTFKNRAPDTTPQTAPALGDFPPDVYLNSLVNNGDRVKDTVTLSAGAQDDKGVTQVEFYSFSWKEKLLGRATQKNGAWTLDWNTKALDDGQYRVYAKATDSSGQVSTSAQVTVSVVK